MKTIATTKLKKHALKILDQVAKTQENIAITKRGKPLAVITPYRNPDTNPRPGILA